MIGTVNGKINALNGTIYFAVDCSYERKCLHEYINHYSWKPSIIHFILKSLNSILTCAFVIDTLMKSFSRVLQYEPPPPKKKKKIVWIRWKLNFDKCWSAYCFFNMRCCRWGQRKPKQLQSGNIYYILRVHFDFIHHCWVITFYHIKLQYKLFTGYYNSMPASKIDSFSYIISSQEHVCLIECFCCHVL